MNPLPVAGKRDQIQIHGIQNQFDRHQHNDHVPPREHANDSEQEQSSAQD